MSDEDEDRAAILKRRQRLIALALSGLSGAAAGCDDPKPPPEAPAHERAVDDGTGAALDEDTSGPMAPVDTEAEPDDDDELAAAVDDGPPDPSEVRHAEERKRRWQQRARPRPCLSPIPTACLSMRPVQPTVCLWKKPIDEPDDEPA